MDDFLAIMCCCSRCDSIVDTAGRISADYILRHREHHDVHPVFPTSDANQGRSQAMSFLIPIVVVAVAIWLVSLVMTRHYTFCEKCQQRRWHKVRFNYSKDMHRNILYDVWTCWCMTCDHMKWSEDK